MIGLVAPDAGPTAPRHRAVPRDAAVTEERAATVVVELRGELDGAAEVEVECCSRPGWAAPPGVIFAIWADTVWGYPPHHPGPVIYRAPEPTMLSAAAGDGSRAPGVSPPSRPSRVSRSVVW